MKTLTEKQKLDEQSWEGYDGCTEHDKFMWKNGFVHGYNNTAPKFMDNIDWELLKKQKTDLITLIKHQSCGKFDLWNNVQGIIYLIDAIQDYAVDVLGIDENVVFNLEDDGNN